jgi:hypothetical protein
VKAEVTKPAEIDRKLLVLISRIPQGNVVAIAGRRKKGAPRFRTRLCANRSGDAAIPPYQGPLPDSIRFGATLPRFDNWEETFDDRVILVQIDIETDALSAGQSAQ